MLYAAFASSSRWGYIWMTGVSPVVFASAVDTLYRYVESLSAPDWISVEELP